MFHDKKWICNVPGTKKIKDMADEMGISPLLAMVLVSRGIDTREEAERFLYPDIGQLGDPFLLPDMEVSAQRIIHALDRGERICIYGDYDVDGITSVSFLMKVLTALGADVTYYIPGRMEEGYGLNAKSVREIGEAGTGLIITVDCGISSHEEVDLCNAMGMDVIVTDHHRCPPELPPALGVINPKRGDSRYPFCEFAGVGVAYKLCAALETIRFRNETSKTAGKPLADSMLDIVALGTVADIVPLTGENRVLVSLGLKKMSATENIGLKALLKVAGVKEGQINAEQAAFALAPRLNAAGRLADAQKGVRLLLSEDEETALLLAKELDARNRERQRMENEILDKAVEMAEKRKGDSILVLAWENWHPGVIGIVASRVVDRYNKPAILFSIDGDEARGSARSIPGLDLFSLLSTCRHYYKSFGGHKQAAGLTIETDKLEVFAREINTAADKAIMCMEARPIIKADGDLTGIRVSVEDAASLRMLEPCGCGNPPPLFIKRRVGVAAVKRVGKKGEHLKLTVNEEGRRLDCIAFRWGDTGWPVTGQRPDMVFTPGVNSWLGRESLQLVVKDMKDLSWDEAFLRRWYISLEDLERHQALAPGADMVLSGADTVKTDCGFAYLKDVFENSVGNVVMVNGYADVLDAISALSVYPNVEVCFGSLKGFCQDRNYILVHPYCLAGIGDSVERLYCLAHSALPVQLDALRAFKGSKLNILVDDSAVSLGRELMSLIPGRETLVLVYKTIKKRNGLTLDKLLRMAMAKGISPAVTMLTAESLAASRLIEARDGNLVPMPAPPNKVDIHNAAPFRIVKSFALAADKGYDAVKKCIIGV